MMVTMSCGAGAREWAAVGVNGSGIEEGEMERIIYLTDFKK